MTGWRKRQVMEMAREAGYTEGELAWHDEILQRFAELVRADEAEKYKWDVHSCGPTCTKVGCVAVRKAVEAEREACAKVCEDLVPTYLKDGERWLKGRNGKPDSRLKDLAPNLEAAWEAEQLLKHGSVVQKITEAHICANAIRARGDKHD